MTRTEELLALAEKAETFCNKCGYFGKDEPHHKRPGIGDECGYQAARIMNTHPETIKQLVKLAVLQHANMLKIQEHSHGSCVNYAWCKEAIAAFNKFEGGE